MAASTTGKCLAKGDSGTGTLRVPAQPALGERGRTPGRAARPGTPHGRRTCCGSGDLVLAESELLAPRGDEGGEPDGFVHQAGAGTVRPEGFPHRPTRPDPDLPPSTAGSIRRPHVHCDGRSPGTVRPIRPTSSHGA